jgi:glucose/arabinose dehydrogenase
MMKLFPAAYSLLAVLTASCSAPATGDKRSPVAPEASAPPFAMEEMAVFEQPWAITFDQGTGTLFVTEKKGTIGFRTPDGTIGTVTGLPKVDHGGQGGLGDFAFAPGQTSAVLDRRVVYLSWVEAGEDDTRGAVVGRADLTCSGAATCALENLKVIWKQQPKVTGRGHFSHRIAFSPDGQYLFVASGDRQKLQPAQDTTNTLGTIVRLLPDGSPAPGNPLAAQGSPSDQIWSWGHRNVLGLRFDPQGRLWGLEHGPAGGDELNLIRPGANYGWPLASRGRHYDGAAIPDHRAGDGFTAPATSWDPVIAPGDMIFYTGDLFPRWRGSLLIAAMSPAGIVRVTIDWDTAREAARYATRNRIRSIAQAPDGSVWIVEDGRGLERSRLFRLTPARGN